MFHVGAAWFCLHSEFYMPDDARYNLLIKLSEMRYKRVQ